MITTVDQLKKAHDLVSDLTRTERLLAAYREAKEVVVAITDPPRKEAHMAMSSPHDEIKLAAREIGDQIAASLERRIATMTRTLRDLGVA